MDANRKTTFALFFGHRGAFPSLHMAAARKELPAVLEKLGYGWIMMDEAATPHGAVETPAQGRKYAAFLKQHAGEFDGVILSLPNFGDETGAVEALKDAGVPILIQAYPDDLDKMAPEFRRDAFCGKFSVMDVFCQYGIKFTALKPHTVRPSDKRFAEQVHYFAKVCRVVRGMRGMIVGAIGARTTPFKTVRIDELALQRHGITMETFDLSYIFAEARAIRANSNAYQEKANSLKNYAQWTGVPDKAFDTLVRLGVVLDRMIEEHKFDAVTIRCWNEMQTLMGVSPCVLLSELNNRKIPAACEVDVGNAVAMRALSLASDEVPACLDWNNNYGDEDDKCILFHCGPVPQALMSGKGKISDHLILASVTQKGIGYGCNIGRIAPGPLTFASMVTDSGRLKFYIGEGEFTNDPIPPEFFGCAGVAKIPKLQDVLLHVGYNGHRHHTSATRGHVMAPVKEALQRYLGFEVATPQC